jgi:hypothetical protein
MKAFTVHLRLAVCLVATVLAVGLVPMWYRSHQGPEFVKYASPSQWFLSVTSGHGTLDVLYIADWPGEPEFLAGRRGKDVMYATRYGKRFLGFGTAAQTNGGRYVVIPYWFLTACCAAVAVVAGRSWRRQRRVLLQGRCKRCGYDLRATPERCPECGTVAA